MTQDKLYMAPVRGITDLIYRNAFAKHFGGIDVAITPFITTVRGDQIKQSQIDEYVPENNETDIIPQIIGKSPDNFITLAKTLYDLGNEEVNWNLGCPHPTMTRKKCGSGLLPHPDLIDAFLEKVCSETPTKLSVKVRLGLNTNTDLAKLIPIFERYPIKEITIHARTGKQMYKGDVDLDMFQEYLDQCSLPVVYNGDIYSLEDFMQLQKRFPTVKKWMLGRGLFSNPLLAHEIKTSKPAAEDEKAERFIEFHNELLENYQRRLSGDAHLIQRMVGHWEYLHHAFPSGKKLYKKLKKTKSLGEYSCLMLNF